MANGNELRYIPGFIEAGSDEPGLVQALNGDVILVKRDGTRVTLPGGGGSGGTVIEQDTDPGAVGAGTFWVNTTANPDAGIPAIVKPTLVRNAADDGWIEQGLIHYNGDGNLSSFVTLDDGSAVVEGHDADGASNGALAIYGGAGGATFLRGKNTYLQQAAVDAVYFYLGDHFFWFNNVSVGPVWGISSPSGAEKFVAIEAPDASEIDGNQRLHWYDSVTPALRFLQKDQFGALTEGRSASIVGLTNGILRLGQVGNNEGLVADDGTNYSSLDAGQWVLGIDGGDDNSEVYSAGIGHGILSQPSADAIAAFVASALAGGTVALDTGGMNVQLGGSGLVTDTNEIYTFGFSGLLGDNFTDFVQIAVGGVIAGSDIGGVNAETYSMRVGHGIHSNPATGVAAFTAQALAGGTVALDAGGLMIVTDDGTANVLIRPYQFTLESDTTDEAYAITVGTGMVAAGPSGGTCFRATDEAAATVALDCGTLAIVNLPTADPHIAGGLWNNSGTPAISTG